ncbi:GNAT family N-acetyltransferase [Deinococcus aestuarii]|uniref:GNAT family N-acetyltransferase n=1 Tax=Deinococcus aestuarii TaxID=2774531 RepID=UPI001FE4EAA4|nr:GNAT family N-acetyltransferase [Deinococcus aestuarii]
MNSPTGTTFRPALPADAETIQAQRDAMFLDMGSGAERVAQAHAASLGWFRAALADGSFSGVLAEQGGQVVGGAGVIWQSLPLSPRSLPVTRAYLLNVYVRPFARGQGLARRMLQQLLAECARRGVETVSLHASEAGRPVYDRLGFTPTNEMRLTLGETP